MSASYRRMPDENDSKCQMPCTAFLWTVVGQCIRDVNQAYFDNCARKENSISGCAFTFVPGGGAYPVITTSLCVTCNIVPIAVGVVLSPVTLCIDASYSCCQYKYRSGPQDQSMDNDVPPINSKVSKTPPGTTLFSSTNQSSTLANKSTHKQVDKLRR